MANKRISELPVVTTPTSATDVVPVVATGVTSQITIDNVVKAGLKIASTTSLGGVVVGSGLSINGSGVLSATAPASLASLSDVLVVLPQTNGEGLYWNATLSKWVNSNIIDGGNA